MSSDLPISAPYRPVEGRFDEMFDAHGRVRPGCEKVFAGLLSLETSRLAEIRSRADRMFLRMGVTFNVYGADQGSERVFPFDPIPRVIDATTWTSIEAGLVQRVRALNMFIADVYGESSILKDGVVHRDLILSSSQYRRAAVGLRPPLGTFITVAGIDLVRGEDGRFYVLEDNVRTPSGVSYVIENRVVMTRLLPDLIRSCGVRSVEGYRPISCRV